jgi:hypothetical protein
MIAQGFAQHQKKRCGKYAQQATQQTENNYPEKQ